MCRCLVAILGLLALVGPVFADDTKEGSRSEEYLGTWRQVAVVIDGKDTPVGRATLMVVTKEGYAVTIDGQPYQKGKAKVVGGDSPRRSDVVIKEGVGAGATVPQITKVDGDVLIGCQARVGGERPTEFTSRPGSGRILSVWVRVK